MSDRDENGRYEPDDDERRQARAQRRARGGRTVYRTYDDWKLASPDDEAPQPPYGEWCRNPAACAGLGYCPLDPTCGD